MNKQLTRSDYVYMLVVIFLLMCVVASFFYGFQTGTGKVEAKYRSLMAEKPDPAKKTGAYDQSYLVSFYHSVYAPYNEFQTKWFHHLNEIGAGSADTAALLKELGHLAEEKYKAMEAGSVPENSPLLKEAHDGYLKSLKLFQTGIADALPEVKALKKADAEAQLNKQPDIREAKRFALQAQKYYYDAIVKWNETQDQDMPKARVGGAALTVEQWNALNLNQKNAFTAETQLDGLAFADYTPQDLTARIDDMVRSGRAKKMKLDEVRKITQVLTDTGAVRAGDFLKEKAAWYDNEPLPLLPFFSH